MPLVGCHSSRSNDLSVHARTDSAGYVRRLQESSEEEEDKKSHAAIFEVKFGKKKKAEASITDSRERTTDTLFSDLESVALAIEGSDLDTLEDNYFVPTAKFIQDTNREATGDQIRPSKTTVLCMPSPPRAGNEVTFCVFDSFSKQYFNKCTTSRSMSLLEMPMRQHTSISLSRSTKICSILQLPSC